MKVVNLNIFRLEEYESFNRDHRDCIISLENDNQVRNYIGSLERLINNIQNSENGIDSIYIIYFHDRAIGFIDLQMQGEYPEIAYAILKEYRHENISKLILQEFTYYVQDTYGFDTIYGSINPSNISSIKTAEFVGYKRDNSTRYSFKR